MKMFATTGNIYAIVTFLSVLVWKVDCICVDCHLPPNATEKEVERLLVLDFKRRLMERLGFKTEPKVVASAPMSFINAISSSAMMMAGDEPRISDEEPSQITNIVFGPHAGFRVRKNRYSFDFQIKSKLQGSYELAGVKIWMHVNKASKRHWFQIYDNTRWGRKLLVNDSIGIDSLGSDWKAFKLVPNKDWYRTPWKTLHLEIEGINEERNGPLLASKDQQPRLEVRTRFVKKRVYKRSSATKDCPHDGRCCKHTMSLNLTSHIKWLVLPRIIQAIVCRGACPTLYRVRWLRTFITQTQTNKRSCCVPTKLLPISVIVHDKKNQLITTEVNDMMVASCGCS